ncbi:MAG: hypothetical protein L6R48_15270 [Planctomycetes bacterium]|nr:hypothetical protein [Planctomycetota bacterium]
MEETTTPPNAGAEKPARRRNVLRVEVSDETLALALLRRENPVHMAEAFINHKTNEAMATYAAIPPAAP